MNTESLLSRMKCGVWLWAAATMGLMSLGCAIEPGQGDDLRSVEQGVQQAFVRWGPSGAEPVQLATGAGTNWIGHAAGAIRPLGDYWAGGSEGNWEGTCGVTFISPSYGVTAAHCVDQWAVPKIESQASPTKFRVQHARLTSDLTWNKVKDQADIEAYSSYYSSWPDYVQGAEPESLGGYVLTTFSDCVVTRRCDDYFGQNNCNAAGQDWDVDIALIHCPSRAANSFYGDKYATTFHTGTGQSEGAYSGGRFTNGNADTVQNIWYHEIVDGWSEDGGATNLYNYDHYYLYGVEENYHYYSPRETLELFPLISLNRNGVSYESLNASGAYVTTNLPTCHGTSGSGVWRRVDAHNKWYFLGPVVHGPSIGTERLCDDMSDVNTRSAYVNDAYTAWWTTQAYAPEVWAELN